MEVKTREVRYLKINPELEFRAITDSATGKPILAGYAATFNQLSLPMRMWMDNEIIEFQEIIDPKAFDGVLNPTDLDIIYNYNHDDCEIIASLFSKTLRLFTDEKGLGFEADVDLEVSYASDLYNNVKSGRIYGNSFAFTIAEDSWKENSDGTWLRTILKVDELYDVSSVSRSAYPNTELAIRSFDKMKKSLSESITERKVEKTDDIYSEISMRNDWDSDYLTILSLRLNRIKNN
jgi:uncharacterized protein